VALVVSVGRGWTFLPLCRHYGLGGEQRGAHPNTHRDHRSPTRGFGRRGRGWCPLLWGGKAYGVALFPSVPSIRKRSST